MQRCPITSCEGGTFSEVWVINADGANRVKITNYSAHDSMGDWQIELPLPKLNALATHQRRPVAIETRPTGLE